MPRILGEKCGLSQWILYCHPLISQAKYHCCSATIGDLRRSKMTIYPDLGTVSYQIVAWVIVKPIILTQNPHQIFFNRCHLPFYFLHPKISNKGSMVLQERKNCQLIPFILPEVEERAFDKSDPLKKGTFWMGKSTCIFS